MPEDARSLLDKIKAAIADLGIHPADLIEDLAELERRIGELERAKAADRERRHKLHQRLALLRLRID